MSQPSAPRRTRPTALVVVVVAVGIQAAALLAAAGWGLVEVVAGRVASVPASLAMVLGLAGAAVVLALAVRALGRGSRPARSALVAWNLLMLATVAAVAQATGLVVAWVVALVPLAAAVAVLSPTISRSLPAHRPEAG